MPTKYLDEEGLSHVVRRAKETFAEKKELWNWQKTEKAGAVAFEPVPDSVLEPVVEFKFKETLPAEGEKGPDNPSTIQGVSNIIVGCRGKNLYNIVLSDCFGVTFSRDDDGTITINGTCTKSIGENVTFYTNTFGVRLSGTNLVSSIKHLGGSFTLPDGVSCPIWVQLANVYPSIVHYRWMNDDGTDEGSIKAYGLDSTNTSTFDNSAFRVFGGVTYNNYKIRVQYELTDDGNPTEYEAPNISKYNLPLGSSYYGGSLDVNSGLLTVTWESKTLTGTEDWSIQSQVQDTDTFTTFQSQLDLVRYVMTDDPSSTTRFCSHFSYGLSDTNYETYYTWAGATNVLFRRLKSEFSDVDSFKSWLVSEYNAGHPVVIGYKLRSPYTIQLDPIQIKSLASLDKYEPRINTVYTDAESIQVGYQKFTAEGNFVHTTGDETIEGVKTFANATPGSTAGDSVTDLTIRNPAITRGVREAGVNWTRMIFADKDGDTEGNFAGRLGIFEIRSPKTNEYNNNGGEQFRFRCYKYSNSSSDYSKSTDIILGYDKDGIAYATAPSTSIDRSVDTDIVTRDWLPKDTRIPQKSDLWNWQKTEKAGVVAFKPVPGSDLEPIVDFMFTETPPVEGEKSPTNPSAITGVSSIKIIRCGKNLFTYPYYDSPQTINGVEWTVRSDGSVIANGTTLPNTRSAFRIVYNKLLPAGTYTLYLNPGIIDVCDAFLSYGSTTIWGNAQPRTFTLSTPQTVNCYLRVAVGASVNNFVYTPQLELGTAATSFELYSGSEYTFSLENIYYGGTLDASTGIMTVRWESVILDGTENWTDGATVGDGIYRYQLINDYNDKYHPLGNSNQTCSHFNYLQDWTSATVHWYSNTPDGNAWFFTDAQTTIADWKSWLAAQKAAGTPVTFAAKVAPFTVQLTPQQIKALASTDKYMPRTNTIYTDAASVQVGYQRFADESTIVYQDQCIPEEEIDEAFAE